MAYEDYVRTERAKRNTSYLAPQEMTRKELEQEHTRCINFYLKFLELAGSLRSRAAIMTAELSKENRMNVISGGGKKTPRKKICRIHEWDIETNTRIRGHKYDWRMPKKMGNK